VTVLNTIFLFICPVHFWVELKACIWSCCTRCIPEVFSNLGLVESTDATILLSLEAVIVTSTSIVEITSR
jgi:hypothetical protein